MSSHSNNSNESDANGREDTFEITRHKSEQSNVSKGKAKFRLLESAHRGDLVEMVPNPHERTIRKVVPNPTVTFNKHSTSTSISSAISSAIGTDGSVYTFGFYKSIINFDGFILTSALGGIFLAKMDRFKQWEWAIKLAEFTTPTNGLINGEITTDNESNVYICYNVFGKLQFPVIPVVAPLSNSNTNTVICKVEASSVIKYITNVLFSNNPSTEIRISNDQHGHAYICGAFTGQVKLGHLTLTTGNVNNIYIAKLCLTGNYLWAKMGTLDTYIVLYQ